MTSRIWLHSSICSITFLITNTICYSYQELQTTTSLLSEGIIIILVSSIWVILSLWMLYTRIIRPENIRIRGELAYAYNWFSSVYPPSNVYIRVLKFNLTYQLAHVFHYGMSITNTWGEFIYNRKYNCVIVLKTKYWIRTLFHELVHAQQYTHNGLYHRHLLGHNKSQYVQDPYELYADRIADELYCLYMDGSPAIFMNTVPPMNMSVLADRLGIEAPDFLLNEEK
jgi:hypothetical protein